MPDPLSAWKYLLWTPALPSTQHRQLWELFKQGRSTDGRRLIWRDEGIRKWNLQWCAEGMEREFPPGPPGLLAFLMGACVENRCICVAFTLSARRGLCETRASRRARDSTARHQFICKGAAIVCRQLSSAQRSALCCCRFYDREIRARGSAQRLPTGVYFILFIFWVKIFSAQALFPRMRCFTCRLSDACPVDLTWHGALF